MQRCVNSRYWTEVALELCIGAHMCVCVCLCVFVCVSLCARPHVRLSVCLSCVGICSFWLPSTMLGAIFMLILTLICSYFFVFLDSQAVSFTGAKWDQKLYRHHTGYDVTERGNLDAICIVPSWFGDIYVLNYCRFSWTSSFSQFLFHTLCLMDLVYVGPDIQPLLCPSEILITAVIQPTYCFTQPTYKFTHSFSFFPFIQQFYWDIPIDCVLVSIWTRVLPNFSWRRFRHAHTQENPWTETILLTTASSIFWLRYARGLREYKAKDVHARKPTEVVRHAVLGMLPKNNTRHHRIARLHLFPDEVIY